MTDMFKTATNSSTSQSLLVHLTTRHNKLGQKGIVLKTQINKTE